MLVWSVQNRSISSEICLEINHKICCFLPIAFWWSFPRKLPRNFREIGWFFREFDPKNPAKFDFFFRDLSEALLSALVYCMGIRWAFFTVKELDGTTFSILPSLFSLPAIPARYITNPWGLFLRNSAIKLQKHSNPPSWAENWQQMSTNPGDHAHISPQGELTPLPPTPGMTIDKCIIIRLQSHFAEGAPSV